MKQLLVVALLVVVLSATAAFANFVTFTNCTDKMCKSGCQSTQVATDSCLGRSPFSSQIIRCHKSVDACGQLDYFVDDKCTQQFMSDAFVCDQCNDDQQSAEKKVYSQIACLNVNDVEYLRVSHCSKGCTHCTQVLNATTATCIPVKPNMRSHFAKRHHAKLPDSIGANQMVYVKYAGASVCGTLELQQYDHSVDCSGAYQHDPWLPQDRCIGGAKFDCTFD